MLAPTHQRDVRRIALALLALSLILLVSAAWTSRERASFDTSWVTATPWKWRSGSLRKSLSWIPVTMLSPAARDVWSNPEPAVIFPGMEQLLVVAAVVMDQETTWQEGSRPPYYMRMLLYPEPLDPRTVDLGNWLQRVNVTFPAFPKIPSSRCRPYAYQSNYPPLREVLAHELILQLECDIPRAIADERTGPPSQISAHLSYETVRLNKTTETELLAAAKEGGPFFPYPKHLLSTPEPATMALTLQSQSVRFTKYTFCAAPFRDYAEMIGDMVPLRYIEYRLYFQKLGVSRFVWYAYRTEQRWITFLRAFLQTFENEDEILVIDNIKGSTGYHDQNIWLGHCGDYYRTATDYLLIFDLDETVALNPAHYDDPARHFNEWIDGWKPDVGAYAMLRQDLSTSKETFEMVDAIGAPTAEMLAQDVWHTKCTDPLLISRYLRKTIHRARAVMQIWIHHGIWMYPVPGDPSLPMESREDDDFPKPKTWGRELWPHEMWHQNISGVVDYFDMWPRSYHYRWWGGQAQYEIGNEALPSHPNLVAFQNALRDEVHAIGRLIRPKLVVQKNAVLSK